MKIIIKILTLVQQLFHKIYLGLHCSESQKLAIQSRIHIQEHVIIPWISLFKKRYNSYSFITLHT